MKPNFKSISLAELRDYVKQHITDDEAIRDLFVNRRNPNTKQYRAPLDEEGIKTREEAIINELQSN